MSRGLGKHQRNILNKKYWKYRFQTMDTIEFWYFCRVYLGRRPTDTEYHSILRAARSLEKLGYISISSERRKPNWWDLTQGRNLPVIFNLTRRK